MTQPIQHTGYENNSRTISYTDSLDENGKMDGIREAVGIFMSVPDLRAAITELDAYFPRDALSVLGNRHQLEMEFGEPTVSPERVEDDSHTPRSTPVRPEDKIIGNTALIGSSTFCGAAAAAIAAGALTIPAAITAVAIGASTGAAISTILAELLEKGFHKEIEEQIEKGGLLLWVNTPDTAREEIACDIMNRHGAVHVKVHTLK